MTLTKDKLADLVSTQMNVAVEESKKLVDLLFETLKDGINDEGTLTVSGFGKFEVKQKKERRGRNPQTGESLTLSPRKVVSFYHSPVLKNRLNMNRP